MCVLLFYFILACAHCFLETLITIIFSLTLHTGKTFLLTKKVVREDVELRVLVITRLPRLLSTIKNVAEQERNTNYVTFSTYDDLLGELAGPLKRF